MTLRSRHATTTLAFALALAGLAGAALAAPASLPGQDRQHTIADLVGANAALAHGQMTAAVNNTANAETVLLNAQQAGHPIDAHALQAVQEAHRALLKNDRPAARAAIRNAESDLNAPRNG